MSCWYFLCIGIFGWHTDGDEIDKETAGERTDAGRHNAAWGLALIRSSHSIAFYNNNKNSKKKEFLTILITQGCSVLSSLFIFNAFASSLTFSCVSLSKETTPNTELFTYYIKNKKKKREEVGKNLNLWLGGFGCKECVAKIGLFSNVVQVCFSNCMLIDVRRSGLVSPQCVGMDYEHLVCVQIQKAVSIRKDSNRVV